MIGKSEYMCQAARSLQTSLTPITNSMTLNCKQIFEQINLPYYMEWLIPGRYDLSFPLK